LADVTKMDALVPYEFNTGRFQSQFKNDVAEPSFCTTWFG